jgi:hypothetical protein
MTRQEAAWLSSLTHAVTAPVGAGEVDVVGSGTPAT